MGFGGVSIDTSIVALTQPAANNVYKQSLVVYNSLQHDGEPFAVNIFIAGWNTG